MFGRKYPQQTVDEYMSWWFPLAMRWEVSDPNRLTKDGLVDAAFPFRHAFSTRLPGNVQRSIAKAAEGVSDRIGSRETLQEAVEAARAPLCKYLDSVRLVVASTGRYTPDSVVAEDCFQQSIQKLDRWVREARSA